MKQWVLLLCTLMLVVALSPLYVVEASTPADWFSGGAGTEANPYQIRNVYELQNVTNSLTTDYILMNDIDASMTSGWNGGDGFEPIGTSANHFTGTFDGQNYTITSLYIERSATDYVGLFGQTGTGSVVENMGLINHTTTGTDWVGGLIGSNRGSVNNCYATGTTSGGQLVGGLIGANTGVVNNSYATGTTTGTNFVGGLIGSNEGSASVSNSYATGTTTGTNNYVGGLIGSNEGSGSVSNSYATGTTTGATLVGGLIGENDGSVSNSFWDTETSGQATSDGGTGKTTAEMQTLATFSDNATVGLTTSWDIALVADHTTETWYIDEHNDYPRLSYQEKPPTPPAPVAATPTPMRDIVTMLSGLLPFIVIVGLFLLLLSAFLGEEQKKG